MFTTCFSLYGVKKLNLTDKLQEIKFQVILCTEMDENIENLKAMISERDDEIRLLKLQLKEKNAVPSNASLRTEVCEKDLSADEIMRYSRQLIMPEIGMRGQIALKKTTVLIVGAGGLGCPAAIYLAAAGVGEIGIVDYDKVDLTNLHRQVAHVVSSVGQEKCLSLLRSIKNINPHVKCNIYPVLLNKNNIEKIIKKYEIIIDASDNVPTRYLLNDASVLNKKILVSGSALRFEGQLTVYNYLDGPCYRCLFPDPPPPNATTNCSEGGVLGAVTSVIGSLQALEVIKIAIGLYPSYYKKMLVFDGLSGDIRVIKLRNKKRNCKICGNEPTVKQLVDYELFCNTSATDKEENISLLPSSSRITCKEYKKLLDNSTEHILLDVRSPMEIQICSLPNCINIPFSEVSSECSVSKLKAIIEEKKFSTNYVICRRGNDSQRAVILLQKLMKNCIWKDIIGGLYAWHDEIDSSLPLY